MDENNAYNINNNYNRYGCEFNAFSCVFCYII